MRMIALIVSALVAIASPVAAQETVTGLTVIEVAGVVTAIRSLKTYDAQDKGGNPIKLAYKFDGAVLLTMARNVRAGEAVVSAYQDAINALIAQTAENGKIPDDKVAEFNRQTSVMGKQATGVELVRMKEQDLRLSENPIPAETIALLLPIIDGVKKQDK